MTRMHRSCPTKQEYSITQHFRAYNKGKSETKGCCPYETDPLDTTALLPCHPARGGWPCRADYQGTAPSRRLETVRQPKLSPPPALFPIVWTVLYLLMGISSYLVCSAPVPQPARKQTLLPYALQLFFNFVWPLLFFRQQAVLPAFFWLVILWALVLWMILAFRKVNRTAAWLQVPYLLWLTFAGYLNLAVWLLNP